MTLSAVGLPFSKGHSTNSIKPNFDYFFNACPRSSIKSSAFSKPTDNLISLSLIPDCYLCSLGIEAWLMVAGCSAREVTPPSDSARENSFIFLKKLVAAVLPPFTSNETTPLNPVICLLAISWPG